ncbi:hypothetical protein EYF80_062421 [Liparis tanakae]|uniref:Uncharacterized protein n=1 Tax=Liparis tanakae TaxID=230148 RepID=A0A4Z2EFF3_9TELE|nr:hypothetical protein EYF80_062421 [Liparis tanakae]
MSMTSNCPLKSFFVCWVHLISVDRYVKGDKAAAPREAEEPSTEERIPLNKTNRKRRQRGAGSCSPPSSRLSLLAVLLWPRPLCGTAVWNPSALIGRQTSQGPRRAFMPLRASLHAERLRLRLLFLTEHKDFSVRSKATEVLVFLNFQELRLLLLSAAHVSMWTTGDALVLDGSSQKWLRSHVAANR